MPDYEFCRNMDQEMIANRIRSLKNDELSALVENVIEDHRRVGELHDDVELEELTSYLQDRWPDFQAETGIA